MNEKTVNTTPVWLSEAGATDKVLNADAVLSRRVFVEPEISFPIDVLEATTFFQITESGVITP